MSPVQVTVVDPQALSATTANPAVTIFRDCRTSNQASLHGSRGTSKCCWAPGTNARDAHSSLSGTASCFPTLFIQHLLNITQA